MCYTRWIGYQYLVFRLKDLTVIRGLNLMIAKSTKSMVFSQKSAKTAVFSQKLQILQFLSLKLQHCWSVSSPERGTKGVTSIFPWKTVKSMDLGQNPWILWFRGRFKVKNYISHSTLKRTSKHTLKSMDFCIVYPIDSRPFDLIFVLCTKLTPFKTISPPFLKWSWKESIGYTIKNQVIWFWKESIGYTMIKWCQMVLKGVNWIHNAKIRSYCLERSQLCTQSKNQVKRLERSQLGT